MSNVTLHPMSAQDVEKFLVCSPRFEKNFLRIYYDRV